MTTNQTSKVRYAVFLFVFVFVLFCFTIDVHGRAFPDVAGTGNLLWLSWIYLIQFSRAATTFNARCTEDLTVKFCQSLLCKVVTVLYHGLGMISFMCKRAIIPGTATALALQCADIVNCESRDYKNHSLVWGRNGIPQTGVPLAYTITPLGTSAGCFCIAHVLVKICNDYNSGITLSRAEVVRL